MKPHLGLVLCIGLALAGCNQTKPVEAAGNSSSAPLTGLIPESSRVQDVWLSAGTKVRVRLIDALDTRRNRAGDSFTASLDQPVVVGDRVILPQGTSFYGHITESRPSGRFKGRAVLAMKLDSLELNGRHHEIRSNSSARASGGHKKHHWLWIGGGSGGGAAIGAAAGGGAGALIGAGAGAAAGTIGSAITGKRQVHLPPETAVTFTLQDPVNIGNTRS